MICSSRRIENESTFSENDFVTYKSLYGQQMYLIKCHLIKINLIKLRFMKEN